MSLALATLAVTLLCHGCLLDDPTQRPARCSDHDPRCADHVADPGDTRDTRDAATDPRAVLADLGLLAPGQDAHGVGWAPVPGACPDRVRVSEVLPNPTGNESDGEWIELVGPPGHAADGLSLVATREDGTENHRVPLSLAFDATGVLLVHGRHGGPDAAPTACARSTGCLLNGGGAVRVIGCDGTLLDELAWGPAAGIVPAEGVSVERCSDLPDRVLLRSPPTPGVPGPHCATTILPDAGPDADEPRDASPHLDAPDAPSHEDIDTTVLDPRTPDTPPRDAGTSDATHTTHDSGVGDLGHAHHDAPPDVDERDAPPDAPRLPDARTPDVEAATDPDTAPGTADAVDARAADTAPSCPVEPWIEEIGFGPGLSFVDVRSRVPAPYAAPVLRSDGRLLLLRRVDATRWIVDDYALNLDPTTVSISLWACGTLVEEFPTPRDAALLRTISAGESVTRCPGATNGPWARAWSSAPEEPVDLAQLAQPAVCGGSADCSVAPILAEVLYDPAGPDDGHEHVELHVPPGTLLQDVELRHINGADNRTIGSVALAGQVGERGTWLVGGAQVWNRDANLPFGLQNGPDILELRVCGRLVDRIGWGTGPAPTDHPEGVAPSGRALHRCRTGGVDRLVDGPPTPGARDPTPCDGG